MRFDLLPFVEPLRDEAVFDLADFEPDDACVTEEPDRFFALVLAVGLAADARTDVTVRAHMRQVQTTAREPARRIESSSST